ncbi:hypothetical protein [Caulobacter sp.]|uniref:hypothetical protein n=1 Tax=Caulobacter sp. TaxID=78 RepID=UPI0031D4884F
MTDLSDAFHDAYREETEEIDKAFRQPAPPKGTPVLTNRTPVHVRPKPPAKPGAWEDYGWRGVVGGVADAGFSFLDTVGSVDRKVGVAIERGLHNTFGITLPGGVIRGPDGKMRIGSAAEFDAAQTALSASVRGSLKQALPEPVRGGAKVTRDISEFAANFVPIMKATSAVNKLGTVAKWTRPMLASAVASYQKLDPLEGNLANLAKQAGIHENEVAKFLHVDDVVTALAVNETDSEVVARFKNAGADIVTGIAMDAAFTGVVKAARLLKQAKVEKLEMVAREAAPTQPADIDPATVAKAVDEQAAAEAAPTLAAKADPAPSLVKEEGPALAADAPPGAQGELFDNARSAAPDVLDEFERVHLDVANKVKGLSAPELKQLADDHAAGKGFTMLERMGVNPARLDFGKFLAKHADEAQAMDALHDWVARIATAAEPMSLHLGSAPRSTKSTLMMANMLGTDTQTIVKTFGEKTKNLDVYANAASGLIGGEAQKLLVLAEKASKFTKEAGSPEYIAFLKQLETVSVLQAAFRGSASSMGRGLRSLQNIVGAREGGERLARARSVLGKDPADVTPKVPKSFEDKLTALGEAKTQFQRDRLIASILKHKGDLAKVIGAADKFSGVAGKLRVFRETAASLFSPGTAAFNFIGGGLMIGTRVATGYTAKAGLMFTKNPEWVAAAASHDAYVGTLLPAMWHGATRSVQVLAREMIGEAKAAAEGAGSSAALGKLDAASAWVERQFGKVPLMSAEKVGSDVGSTAGTRFERPDARNEKLWHIDAQTIDAWKDSPEHGIPFFSAGWRTLTGLAFNTFGATTRTARHLAIGLPDELIGQTMFDAARYSEAVRTATLSGIDLGMDGAALKEFAERRAHELIDNPSTQYLDQLEDLISAGSQDKDRIRFLAQEALDRSNVETMAESEARRVLFQNRLEAPALRGLANAVQTIDPAGIIVPFVHTPLAIIESAARDFTPVGLLYRSMQEKIQAGGPEATELIARWTLGTALILEGYVGAANGDLVGYDGGPQASSRLSRPQYAYKGVEYGRADPVALPLGLGADIFYWQHKLSEEDKEQTGNDLVQLLQAGALAVSTSVLSKSWLKSLQNTLGMADAKTGEYSREQFLAGLAQRTVPLGGFQKYLDQASNDAMRATTTLREKWEASVIGLSGGLEVRHDALLGLPVEFDRTLGVKRSDGDTTALVKEMTRLNFDMPRDVKKLGGVELKTAQVERLKVIMGTEVRLGGTTLVEKLSALVASPRYAYLTDYQREALIRDTRADYLDLAKRKLADEDKTLADDMAAQDFLKRLQDNGAPPETIPAEMRRFREQLLGTTP